MSDIDFDTLTGKLNTHKRMGLGHFPTPLEPLHNLSRWLNGPGIFVKRDDTSGLGQGGNKIRALEFLIPDALDCGADILVTSGVIQSNSVRQVAAAAAKVGLDCHFAVITDRVADTDKDYEQTGNMFLNRLYGATHEPVSIRDDKDKTLAGIAGRLRDEGRHPYIIPYGCANLLGAMGYLNAALETAKQIVEKNLNITHIVHASGTGGTQAGLLVGFALLKMPVEIIGIDIDADEQGVRNRVKKMVRLLANEVGLESAPLEEKIIIEPNYSAGQYGKADDTTLEAMTISSRLEALTTDPVYSAKGLAGILGLSRKGGLKKSDGVIFLHTGGIPAIYAYRSLFGY